MSNIYFWILCFCGKSPHIVKHPYCLLFIALAACLLPYSAAAVQVVILVPGGGVVVLDVAHAGPMGQLVEPEPPSDGGFRPPTIFAAPLPVGSGARALGQAGAFTAVADDATAASWNPAGLVQLERPEVSAVYRYSAREDRHESRNADLSTGMDQYDSSELNYLSAVYPFLLNDRNAVVSVNYQEAYDFTQEFTARFAADGLKNVSTTINQTFYSNTTNDYPSPFASLTVTANTTTEAESKIDQVLKSSLLSSIDFRQSGTIDAFSPAFSYEVSPRFSLGIALNIHTDGASRGNRIESTMNAEYAGTSDSVAQIVDTRSSTSLVQYEGELYGGSPGNVTTNPVSDSFTTTFSDVQTNQQTDAYLVEGSYREMNETENFIGINATIGAMWNANDRLTFGASLDLPWTGYGSQTKRIDHQVSTFDTNGIEVANTVFQDTSKRDVEYTFPLYWSVGALWRWSDRFYTSMDASRTYWSDYTYKAEGEERINPLTGEPHSSSKLDDCWSVRLGGEYLWMLSWTEIPLRGGLFWEQRPAVGRPDEYWGVSVGSGISLGKDPGRVVVDVAYIFEQGNNVMGAQLPEQAVLSDTTKHQIFVSAIWHF